MPHATRYRKGDKIGGRYLVYQALAGGMGEVYLCLDLKEYVPFALKTFQERFLENVHLRRAFDSEVATWVGLGRHPNIVNCSHLDRIENRPFMFLEWILGDELHGTDLRGWLRNGPLDPQVAQGFAIDIARGLIHADRMQPGIVHRDLKPENVLVGPGRVAKITDFGLAKVVQSAGFEILATERKPGARQSLISREIKSQGLRRTWRRSNG